MTEKQLHLIELIANARYRKAMAQRQLDKSSAQYKKLCHELDETRLISGIYDINGRLVRLEVSSYELKIEPVQVRT